MPCTFEARRKFQQFLMTQARASEERRYLGKEQQLTRSIGSTMTNFRGTRSTALHSMSAPAGSRSHFDNTFSTHLAHSSQAWPRSLGVRWDGEHIDHTKAPEMRPNPKFSRMDQAEAEKQFSCYFGNRMSNCAELKAKIAKQQSADMDKYSSAPHVFRPDLPKRHGKFGRRDFDPQVKEQHVDMLMAACT